MSRFYAKFYTSSKQFLNGFAVHDSSAVAAVLHPEFFTFERGPVRVATEGIAREIENRAAFGNVQIALLEEHPFLAEAAAAAKGPVVVVGLFSGEGLHGARDAPRLIAELARDDIVYAGVIGSAEGIDELVIASLERALAAEP